MVGSAFAFMGGHVYIYIYVCIHVHRLYRTNPHHKEHKKPTQGNFTVIQYSVTSLYIYIYTCICIYIYICRYAHSQIHVQYTHVYVLQVPVGFLHPGRLDP